MAGRKTPSSSTSHSRTLSYRETSNKRDDGEEEKALDEDTEEAGDNEGVEASPE